LVLPGIVSRLALNTAAAAAHGTTASHGVGAPVQAAAFTAAMAVALGAARRVHDGQQRRRRMCVGRSAEGKGVAEAAASSGAASSPSTLDEVMASVSAAKAAKSAQEGSERKRLDQEKPSEVFRVDEQLGVCAPMGFFDPAGFCPKDKYEFREMRIKELKHGRIAMLAAVGFVAQHYIRFPLVEFDEVPNGISALAAVPGGVGFGVVGFCAMCLEFVFWVDNPAKEVGDFGDPAGFQMVLGEADADMRNRELNNGRFAMFAAIGIMLAELLSGKDAIEQLGVDLA